MKKRCISFILISLLILSLNLSFSSAAVQRDSRANVTAVIDDVAKWYSTSFGKEYTNTRQFMIEIANQESWLGTHPNAYTNDGGNGFAQITSIALKDIKNKLSKNPDRVAKIKKKWGFDPLTLSVDDLTSTSSDPKALLNADIKSAVILREFLLRDTRSVPKTVELRAQRWKEMYNTKEGKGTTQKYITRNTYRDATGNNWIYTGTYSNKNGNLQHRYVSLKDSKIKSSVSSAGLSPRFLHMSEKA